MVESPKSTRVISYVRTIPFHADTITVNTTLTLVDVLQTIQPLSTVALLELDITYGVQDDPVDELTEWYAAVVDVDALGTFQALRNIADWQSAQNWRIIGTDAGPVQTLSRENEVMFNPRLHGSLSLSQRKRRQALAILSRSTVESTILVLGVAKLQVNLIQRNWRGDNSYDDLSFEEEILHLVQ